jgi:hypothetical protein
MPSTRYVGQSTCGRRRNEAGREASLTQCTSPAPVSNSFWRYRARRLLPTALVRGPAGTGGRDANGRRGLDGTPVNASVLTSSSGLCFAWVAWGFAWFCCRPSWTSETPSCSLAPALPFHGRTTSVRRPPPRPHAAGSNPSNTPHDRRAPRTAPPPRHHTNCRRSSSAPGAALGIPARRRAFRSRPGAACVPRGRRSSGWVGARDPAWRTLGAPPRQRRTVRRNHDRPGPGRQLVTMVEAIEFG